jgi:hypothetical protein
LYAAVRHREDHDHTLFRHHRTRACVQQIGVDYEYFCDVVGEQVLVSFAFWVFLGFLVCAPKRPGWTLQVLNATELLEQAGVALSAAA